ncbi:NAD(P)-binding domain-containing protein [Actinopolymorpha sp. B11F2]|uniref:NAD(P)-binding domain-containing protein n=1 Tax=Actinopolymorpha sp. B11F2 TaxID=3160862 RepID=UPI0032E4EC45
MTTRTTFLGLGAMGSALVRAVLDSGRPAVVWNRTPQRAQALRDRRQIDTGFGEQGFARTFEELRSTA